MGSANNAHIVISKTFRMKSHLAFAAMLCFALVSAWTYLNLKLRGSWSMFRVYCLWNLGVVLCVVPIAWVDFYRYSELYWPCRGVTAVLALLVLGAGFVRPLAPAAGWIAVGLLVDNLFPAISETQSVLERGGWLRLVPTVSTWLMIIIFVRGIQKGVAFPRSATKFDYFGLIKRRGRVNQRATAGGSAQRARGE